MQRYPTCQAKNALHQADGIVRCQQCVVDARNKGENEDDMMDDEVHKVSRVDDLEEVKCDETLSGVRF